MTPSPQSSQLASSRPAALDASGSPRPRLLRSRDRCGAFTLVELLAVVAIIGILTALVFTGLRSLRLSAYRAESVADLRQIGTAVMQYAQDNRGFLPEVQPDSGDAARFWWSHVSPYLTNGIKAETWGEFAGVDALINTYQSRKIAEVTGSEWLARAPSYGMNFRLGATSGYTSTFTPRKLAAVPHPATTLLCSEAGFNSQTPIVALNPDRLLAAAREPKGGELVYSGGAIGGVSHLLWVDGHVSTSRDVAVYSQPPYGPGGEKNVWNRDF